MDETKWSSPEATVRLFQDGNQHCALIGRDIMEGQVGFGLTPASALRALAQALEPQEEHIGTRNPAHEGCCGCVVITESADSDDVIFTCNECGKEVGRAPIPHAP